MKYGMTEEQFQILESLVIHPLKEQGAQVFIFGSRTSSRFHSHSDVDLLYQIHTMLPSGVLSKIKEDIEESRFPFMVDLVNDIDLAESYRKSVDSAKILL